MLEHIDSTDFETDLKTGEMMQYLKSSSTIAALIDTYVIDVRKRCSNKSREAVMTSGFIFR